jgi:hypothetical protein
LKRVSFSIQNLIISNPSSFDENGEEADEKMDLNGARPSFLVCFFLNKLNLFNTGCAN